MDQTTDPAADVVKPAAPPSIAPAPPPQPVPAPFWQGVLEDVHVNASGLVFFACMAVGVIWPEYADKCTKLAKYAGIYLFGAAKNKVQP